MGLAQRYNRTLRRQILHYASWHPVTDPYEVGDYGGFRFGVFQKLGNVREFGVVPKVDIGNSSALDFTSSGMTAVRLEAGVEVKVYSNLNVEAELKIAFSGSNSMYVKAAQVNVSAMRSVEEVARQLRKRKEWDHRWRIVRKVYTAVDPVILVSTERETSFTLSGKADLLKNLELGKGSVQIPVKASSSRVVKVVGGTGPIALDLFRVRVLGSTELEVSEGKEDDDDIDESEDWASDADDPSLPLDSSQLLQDG